MGRSQNGPKAGRGGKFFFLVALHLFIYRIFCFCPSLAQAQAYILLFNWEVGLTLVLHDKHEFYEKGEENEVM